MTRRRALRTSLPLLLVIGLALPPGAPAQWAILVTTGVARTHPMKATAKIAFSAATETIGWKARTAKI